VVYTQGQESGGSGFETCSGVIPRRRSSSVALIPWLIFKLAGESPSSICRQGRAVVVLHITNALCGLVHVNTHNSTD
jgi:hypothetical protein